MHINRSSSSSAKPKKKMFYKFNSKSNWNIAYNKGSFSTFLLCAQHYNWQRGETNNRIFFVTQPSTKIVHYARSRPLQSIYNSHDGKGSSSVVWRYTTCKFGWYALSELVSSHISFACEPTVLIRYLHFVHEGTLGSWYQHERIWHKTRIIVMLRQRVAWEH
jgi:hypothetical protein